MSGIIKANRDNYRGAAKKAIKIKILSGCLFPDGRAAIDFQFRSFSLRPIGTLSFSTERRWKKVVGLRLVNALIERLEEIKEKIALGKWEELGIAQEEEILQIGRAIN